MPRALITGHMGFVGRHFSSFLCSEGWDVEGVDFSDPVNRYVSQHGGAVEFFHDSANDYPFDLLVHCAYNVGGRAAIDGKNLNLAKNLILDAEMFEYAIRSRVKAVLYFSSSAAYPTYLQTEKCHKILKEDDLNLDIGAPDADYGFAKVAGERLAAKSRELGLRVHVVRPFSGYGADQSLDYPFPSIVRRAVEGDLSVWGPKGQARDWIHISDVVRGAFGIYESGDQRPVNLCTGVPTEMGDLALMVDDAINSRADRISFPVTYLTDKPTGVFYRVGDPTRMLEHYTPKISIEEGISEALLYLQGA